MNVPISVLLLNVLRGACNDWICRLRGFLSETDRQADRQTDRRTDLPALNLENSITQCLNICDRGAYVSKNMVFLDVTPCPLESAVSILRVEELLGSSGTRRLNCVAPRAWDHSRKLRYVCGISVLVYIKLNLLKVSFVVSCLTTV